MKRHLVQKLLINLYYCYYKTYCANCGWITSGTKTSERLSLELKNSAQSNFSPGIGPKIEWFSQHYFLHKWESCSLCVITTVSKQNPSFLTALWSFFLLCSLNSWTPKNFTYVELNFQIVNLMNLIVSWVLSGFLFWWR